MTGFGLGTAFGCLLGVGLVWAYETYRYRPVPFRPWPA